MNIADPPASQTRCLVLNDREIELLGGPAAAERYAAQYGATVLRSSAQYPPA